MSISNTIQNKLAAIGQALFPDIPKKLGNQRKEIEAIRQFRIADVMRSYGNKRYDNAKDNVEKLHLLDGLLSLLPGSSKVLWQDDSMVLTGTLNNPVVSTDVVKLRSKLIILLGQEKTDKLFKECEKIAKPARKMTFSDI
jgi:hypothetical protein